MDDLDMVAVEKEIVCLISPYIEKYVNNGHDFKTIYKTIIKALKKIKNKYIEDSKRKLHLSEEMLVIIDLSGSIIYANEIAQKLSGYTLEESIGKNISEMLDEKEIKKLHERLLLRNLGDDKEFFYKSKFKTKDGKIIPIKVGSTIISENNAKFILLTIVHIKK